MKIQQLRKIHRIIIDFCQTGCDMNIRNEGSAPFKMRSLPPAFTGMKYCQSGQGHKKELCSQKNFAVQPSQTYTAGTLSSEPAVNRSRSPYFSKFIFLYVSGWFSVWKTASPALYRSVLSLVFWKYTPFIVIQLSFYRASCCAAFPFLALKRIFSKVQNCDKVLKIGSLFRT